VADAGLCRELEARRAPSRAGRGLAGLLFALRRPTNSSRALKSSTLTLWKCQIRVATSSMTSGPGYRSHGSHRRVAAKFTLDASRSRDSSARTIVRKEKISASAAISDLEKNQTCGSRRKAPASARMHLATKIDLPNNAQSCAKAEASNCQSQSIAVMPLVIDCRGPCEVAHQPIVPQLTSPPRWKKLQSWSSMNHGALRTSDFSIVYRRRRPIQSNFFASNHARRECRITSNRRTILDPAIPAGVPEFRPFHVKLFRPLADCCYLPHSVVLQAIDFLLREVACRMSAFPRKICD